MNFFKDHKIKILMISPLAVGILFFIFSYISGLITVETSDLPKDFKKVSLNISDYQIQQIDPSTNSVKWILKAVGAEASTDESKAKIDSPEIKFYEQDKEKFTINAKEAQLDKINQEITLVNDVVLKTKDGSLKVSSNKMFFSETNPYVEFYDEWQIENNEGYLINGKLGKLYKDKQTIISEGEASLEKKTDSLKIIADKIIVEINSKTPIKAISNSILNIGADKKLFANLIEISTDGSVLAQGSIRVSTPDLQCYSNKMTIKTNKNKKPKTASFTGNPYIIQQGNKLFADEIIYEFDTGEARLLGSVHSG